MREDRRLLTTIINDGGPGFSAAPASAWAVYHSSAYYQGDDHEALAGDGSAHADFTFTGLPAAQYYDVQVAWPAYSNRAPDAPYTITDGSVTLGTRTVNQLVSPDIPADSTGVAWHSLGTFASSTGTLDVRLSSVADGNIEADAVRIVPLAAVPTTAPATVTVAATKPEATEGNPTPGVFTISRTGDLTRALTVAYSVGGIAVAGADYQRLPGQVVIPAGSPSVGVPVIPIGSASNQGNVAVSLFVQGGSNDYVVGDGIQGTDPSQASNATVTIHDGIPAVSIVATAAETTENNDFPASFTLTRTGDVGADLTVAVSVGGTAVSGTTYQPFGATPAANTAIRDIIIPAGLAQVTVPVTASNDTKQTTDRELDLSIAPATAYSVAGRNTVAMTFHRPLVDGGGVRNPTPFERSNVLFPDMNRYLSYYSVPLSPQYAITSFKGSANHGTVIVDPSNTMVEYIPNKRFIGLDQFSFTITANCALQEVINSDNTGYTRVNYLSGSEPLYVVSPVTNTSVYVDDVASADQSTLDFTSDSTASLPVPRQPSVNAQVDDGSIVSWEVADSTGRIRLGQAPTNGGVASWSVPSDQIAGEVYSVTAWVSTITADGGAPAPVVGNAHYLESGTATEAVVPGNAASVVFSRSVDHLIADGQSQTTITLKARDAEGNLVADGTPVDWSLVGGGSLVAPDAVTLNGKATVTLQAGVLAEDQTVSATIDGYSSSTVVKTQAVNIALAVAIGANQATLVTATVTDSGGAPVPNGTPITWFAQKGVIVGDPTVSQGKATASIYLPNGFPASGWGVVKAFVGSNVGSANINYVNGSTQAQASAAHRLIAGDANVDGSYAVEQVDGSTITYKVSAGTDCTIVNAQAGSKVIVSVGSAGANLLSVTGDNGIPGTQASVLIKPDGTATFRVQSLGNLNAGEAVIPITLAYDLTFWQSIFQKYGLAPTPPPIAPFVVAMQPAQHIARTLDYIGKLGWSVLAGPGDSADEIAADMAFSFIPGIGVYSDVRDAVSELSKLWPGGQSPDYVSLGFALAGIIGEVTPADVALDVGKNLYKAAKVGLINPAGIVFTTSIRTLKDLGGKIVSDGAIAVKNLDDFFNGISKLLPPGFGGSPILIGPGGLPYGQYVDSVLQNPDELRGLQSLMSRFDDFPEQLAGFAQRFDAATEAKILQTFTLLPPGVYDAIRSAGKLDDVAAAVKFDIDPAKLDAYAKWLDDVRLDQKAPLPSFARSKQDLVVAQQEASVDSYLVAKGERPEPNLLSYVEGRAGKQGDRYLAGVQVEYKTISNITSFDVAGAISSRIVDATGQASSVLLDARSQANISGNDIIAAATRARGALAKLGRPLDQLRVLLPDGSDKFY